MNTALHEKRARQAWPLLVRRAPSQKPYTYKELSNLIGTHQRVARYYLGVIQDHCRRNRWPRLQALAVNGRSRLPGPGYEGARTVSGHQAELAAVKAKTDWPSKAPF